MNQNVTPNNIPNQNRPIMPNQGRPIANGQVPNGQAMPLPAGPQGPNSNGPRPNNAQQFINQNGNNVQPTKKKKKVLSKELVTIIGVILIAAILYFTYNYQLNKNLEIMTNIPVASTRIKAGHRITADDIKTIDVPASTLKEINPITSIDSIVNMYVMYDTIIPEGSFFYPSVLSKTDLSPDSLFQELKEDEVAVMIDVDSNSTYGNSIMPGNYIDIYAKASRTNKNGEIEYLIGPLVLNAQVLAVKDSSGNNVFADHENKLMPSMFIFGMKTDIKNIIFKAQRLASTEYAVELFPVVNGNFNKSDNETLLSMNDMQDLIENATVSVSSGE